MAASKVMTLRVEPELLEQLHEAARANRRSLSAQVLFLVRRELETSPRRRRAALPTLGWLAHLDAPDDLEEFRRVRRSLARRLGVRARRPARRA